MSREGEMAAAMWLESPKVLSKWRVQINIHKDHTFFLD